MLRGKFMKKDNELIIITDEKEEKATILSTFEDQGQNYVVFEFDETKEISAAKFLESKEAGIGQLLDIETEDRKSTRLNSSHVRISYAVFCLKKKKKNT